jgi:cysteinyl-tRNA synthetase
MKLFNTLSQKLEEFKPLNRDLVTIYTCGPTVYDEAHIGNLRTYIFEDILRRVLKISGYNIKQVMNITDVDDKTIKKSEGNKEEFEKITREYEEKFVEDLEKLDIVLPEKFTRATEYIDKMVPFIEDLLQKGFAYKSEDGSIYFSIDKFKDYGKLSHLDKEGIKSGARVNQDEYDKENPADFALWKAWSPEDGEIYWETKLGKGRPGWHIECSTMSSEELGDSIDIHAGAVDLIFPHHENEIAQSEARSGKEFVKYWLHGEHLLVDGKKMSKSLGNVYKLKDLIEKEFSPLDFRYFVLGAHYRSKLNFTWEGLLAAKNARERLNRIFSESKNENGKVNQNYIDKFNQTIENDLDMPNALAVLWEMMRDEKIDKKDKQATGKEMDKIFGLKLGEIEEAKVPDEIVQLSEKRKTARETKDFALSDKLRDEIKSNGWVIEDLEENNYRLNKN